MLNIIGLIIVTVGALMAGFCTPSPTYLPNGHVQLAPSVSLSARIWMYRKQKYGLPLALSLIAIGSALQLYAAICTLN